MMRPFFFGVLLWIVCITYPATAQPSETTSNDLYRGNVPLYKALPLLDADDPPFERTFGELRDRNPKWKEEAGLLIREWAQKPATYDEREREWTVLLQGFRDEPGVAEWVSKTLRNPRADRVLREHLLRVMARMQALPSDDWRGDLALLLNDDLFRRDVLAVVRKHALPDFDRRIAAMAARTDWSIEMRFAAIDAIAVRSAVGPELFAILLRELRSSNDPVIRLMAGRALSSARLSENQAKELATAIPKLPASWGLLLLAAFSRHRSAEVGLAVVEALRGSPTAQRLTPADLNRVLASFPNEVVRAAQNLRRDVARQVPDEETRAFAKLSGELPPGNATRGREVFLKSKAACSICHRAVGQGGGIGPNLSRVGFLRSTGELLESIVLPNASQVPEFRAWKLTTDRGQSLTGFVVAETSETLLLREADRTLRRIPRVNIEELELSRLSLMPEGIDKLLTKQELADLVQFLADQR